MIIVECGVCHEKYISFSSSWREHEHNDWRACEQTEIQLVSTPREAGRTVTQSRFKTLREEHPEIWFDKAWDRYDDDRR